MGAMVLVVVVLFVLEMIMNDELAWATLIERATARDTLEISEYPPWALARQGNNYQVTLRREPLGVRSSETKEASIREPMKLN